MGECPNDDGDVFAMVAGVAEVEALDPSTVDEARSRSDWEKWEMAIESELKSLADAPTWEVVEHPRSVNVVGCKWVFKIKQNTAGEIDKYKARLVAKGYSQVQGIDYDDTYAPSPVYPLSARSSPSPPAMTGTLKSLTSTRHSLTANSTKEKIYIWTFLQATRRTVNTIARLPNFLLRYTDPNKVH